MTPYGLAGILFLEGLSNLYMTQRAEGISYFKQNKNLMTANVVRANWNKIDTNLWSQKVHWISQEFSQVLAKFTDS